MKNLRNILISFSLAFMTLSVHCGPSDSAKEKNTKEQESVQIGGYYHRQGKNIYYEHTTRYGWLYENKKITHVDMPSADAETFEVLKADKYRSDYYAKDKNYVYYCGIVITNADVQSFQFLGGYYAKDDQHAYFHDTPIKAHTPSFKLIGKEISDAVICKYSSDQNFVYYKAEKIDGSDGSTLRQISSVYDECTIAADRNQVYYDGKVVQGAHGPSFKPHTSFFSVDKDHVFHRNKMIKGSHSATLQVYKEGGNSYAKDKNLVYYRSEPVKEADASTFHYNPESRFFEDKNFRFNWNGKVKEKL